VTEAVWTLWIPGKLPGLNDIVAAAKISRRGVYAEMKREAERRIELAIYDACLPTMSEVWIRYEIVEPNKKRDPGNVLGGAIKFVEDALVRTGVLPNDNWGHIIGYDSVTWRVAPLDGVRVNLRGK
jgi:hypothetical protein